MSSEHLPNFAAADDPHLNDPDTKAAISELLADRITHYQLHPETARPWHEVRASVLQRFEAWKAARRKTA